MNPVISIIIPNYNHAVFIQKRLKTVLEQTFQDFEIILLDDASTDESQKVLEEYAGHSKVSHLILNTRNSGSPFKQWERGIALARGEFIWIAESDDYCEPTFLETLIGGVKKNHVLAYCASKNVDENNKVLGVNSWASGLDPNRWTSSFVNSGKEEIKKFLRYRNTIPNASAVVFRKKALDGLELPLHYKYCGDWYLWLQILNKGDIFYSSKPLNYFRRHDKSSRVVKSFEMEKERFREYSKIVKMNSSLISRILNYRKFEWILVEWEWKKKNFSRFTLFKLGLPLDLLLVDLIRKVN